MKKFTDFIWNQSEENRNKKELSDEHITLQGEQAELTRDERGNFKHPFLSQPSHVSSIYFPDSKSLSIKLRPRE